jgi:hypothetical protein
LAPSPTASNSLLNRPVLNVGWTPNGMVQYCTD